MITVAQIEIAVREAERFLGAAVVATRRLKAEYADVKQGYPTTPATEGSYVSGGSRETGALRRASLDLTQSLAELRRGAR